MPTTQPKNQRICAKCGRAFYGNMDSILCPECAMISRSQNVVMQRICTDCGHNVKGGPRARRCPECRRKAQAENTKLQHKKEISRPLGSMDICQLCGREYIVEGCRQKYRHNCQRDALLEWQRKHKAEYNKRPERIQARKERREQHRKICIYCLRPFWDGTPSNACSEYCRNHSRKES